MLFRFSVLFFFGFLLASTALPASLARAQNVPQDETHAVIYTYYTIDDSGEDERSVTSAQFKEHIEELNNGTYTLLPVLEILKAIKSGKKLPDRSIGITFDNPDKSLVNVAAPLLVQNKIPFTVFVATSAVSDKDPSKITWKDLKSLQDSGLMTLGIHPDHYTRLAGSKDEDIKRPINNALSDMREHIGITPTLFAYPYGEYDEAYIKIISGMGFSAAFGSQSGVLYEQSNTYALPRFAMTSGFADMDRFLLTASALPLPVADTSDASTVLKSYIGFTLTPAIAKKAKSLSCFSSLSDTIDTIFLGDRVELRVKNYAGDKLRINCIIPEQADDESVRWRWYGMLFNPGS